MKLYEILGTPLKKGDVGIEVEVEGLNLAHVREGYWVTKEDGSLRNGLEYVYRKPFPLKNVEESLDQLIKALEDSQLMFSFRTSVHVHVNCLDLEYNEVLNFIYISTLLDSALVNYCGDQRKGNRFCLRLSDAEGLIDVLSPLFSYRGKPNKTLRSLIPANQARYAAVNVESLHKFGTIEFRSMKGTLDKDVLLPWVEVLVGLRDFSRKFSDPSEVWSAICDKGAELFIREALGEHYDKFFYNNLVQDFSLNSSLAIDLPFMEIEKEGEVPVVKRWDVAGGQFTSEEVKAILSRAPDWEYLEPLVHQGAHMDKVLRYYFSWECFVDQLSELVDDVPGVDDLLEWVEEW